jgi:Tfp pilus assembly protein PilN
VELAAAAQRLARFDYLDGLGIAVGVQEVSLVHIAKRFFRVSLRHARTVPLPVSGTERMEALGGTLTQFLQDIDVTPDQIVLCLSRHSACVSRLIVPETARGSLNQIIDYEVERLLPFPKEEIYYDFLTHEIGGEERRLGVMIFALPRREVDEYLDLMTQVQIRPQMITLSTSALTNVLAFCDPPSEVPCVVASAENGEVEFCFVENKRPTASLLFPRVQVQNREEFMDLLAQSVARSLPGISVTEVELFACGGNGALPLTVEEKQDLSALVMSHLVRAETELPPEGSLPALGAALQAVGEAAIEVNILPPDKRARREKRLSPLTLVLVGFIILLGVSWAVGVVVQEQRIMRTLTQKIDELDPEVRRVQTQDEEAGRLKERLQVLEEATRKRLLPLLGNLSELVPTDVYLTNFRYKDGGVELSGVAARSASDLVALLEGSPCLRNVAPKAPFTKTANGETFTLGAQVEPCG